MNSQRGNSNLPRYFITLDKTIIWDYPKDFVLQDGTVGNDAEGGKAYPYETDISAISALIRAYIDTPKAEVYSKYFESDKWGLINILKSADRRIRKRRLLNLSEQLPEQDPAQTIIASRLKQAQNPVKGAG